MNINISDKLIYLGAGCGIGFVIGTLFAPRAGRETREGLSHKVDDFKHKVQQKADSQTLRNVVERGKNVATIGRRRFNESIETDDLSEY